jgi:hypothetical protein
MKALREMLEQYAKEHGGVLLQNVELVVETSFCLELPTCTIYLTYSLVEKGPEVDDG